MRPDLYVTELRFLFFFLVVQTLFQDKQMAMTDKIFNRNILLNKKDDDLNIRRFVTSDAVDGLSRDCQRIKP